MASEVVVKKEKDADAGPTSAAGSEYSGPTEGEFEARFIELMKQFPKGVSNSMLTSDMPATSGNVKANVINRLLSQGKIDVLKQKGAPNDLLYKLKVSGPQLRGADNEERVIAKIVQEAGNMGIWMKDIRNRSGLNQTTLNKVLKAMESKKIIKSISSVQAAKKKVYMLYDTTPDRSITGGPWWSNGEFDIEFVELLHNFCLKLVKQRAEVGAKASGGPMMIRNASFITSAEVLKTITDSDFSRVQLTIGDIESILDTIVYDGKAEKAVDVQGGEAIKRYRAIEGLIDGAGFAHVPCGICPIVQSCSTIGSIRPTSCMYIDEWVDEYVERKIQEEQQQQQQQLV